METLFLAFLSLRMTLAWLDKYPYKFVIYNGRHCNYRSGSSLSFKASDAPFRKRFVKSFYRGKWSSVFDEVPIHDKITPSDYDSPALAIETVEQLQHAILDHGLALKDIVFNSSVVRSTSTSANAISTITTDTSNETQKMGMSLSAHPVLQLIQRRVKTKSIPGSREKNDTATLSLAIEGGGMRGAVSAGMAAAISCLGLADSFDSVYGSSAGSVIGAYLISRQLCVDVYTDVLTTAKSTFVSKRRLLAWIGSSLVDRMVNNIVDSILSTVSEEQSGKDLVQIAKKLDPGMNISFVLDGVMCPKNGLRPLDIESFRLNDLKQPLRIVASTQCDGKLKSSCFGSKEIDFFDIIEDGSMIASTTHSSADSAIPRRGLFACLEASMTVPAATGPPVKLQRCKHDHITTAFDAFCFEPIPYRSAVEEGATHVLVLRTRPDGSPIGTQPTLYETNIAPLYFNGHNMPNVSAYFERGGQQYLYVEDYLTLEKGKSSLDSQSGVKVPPPIILHGVEIDSETKEKYIKRRNETWKQAHLLPIVVPAGTPELPTLSVEKYQVLQAVREGFAAAFDMLAPTAGVYLEEGLHGQRVAELLFPDRMVEKNILEAPVFVLGQPIMEKSSEITSLPAKLMTAHHRDRIKKWTQNNYPMKPSSSAPKYAEENSHQAGTNEKPLHGNRSTKTSPCPKKDAEILLALLPGFESGALISLAKGLHYWNTIEK